jgi:putative ABC transport system permease protein
VTRSLLRFLLWLAPAHFRTRFGAEVLSVHDARRESGAGRRGRLAFDVREVAGLALTVARLRLGGSGTERERTMTTGGGNMLESTLQDLRFAGRTLRRNPGFTLAAVSVLGLGIGANTAIFSATNAFLFRPLPFGDAGRLVMLYETNPEFGWTDATAAPANVLDWREQVDAFADVAMYSTFVNRIPYVRDGEPELVGAINVTGNFFSVLGVKPEVGRGFDWDETWTGNDAVVVLSHAFWVSHHGASPDAVGKTLTFGNTTVEIVGVMPEGFDFPNPEADLWSPWGWDPANRQAAFFRRAHWVSPIARLKPGVTPERANTELQVVVDRLQKDFPETNRVMGAGLTPLRDFLVKDVRRPLGVLLGAVALLLLLACTNVANLMLVRASDRTREVALRFAMGARGRRILRQMLTEGLLLALLGGAVGLALGWVGVRAIARMQPIGITGATTLALDGRVVLFTVGVAVASGLLFGLAPALRATRGDLQGALKEGGRGGSAGRGTMRTVGMLVSVEVGLAVLLVVGAVLMVRTFWMLRSVDPGFRTEGVVAVQFGIPSARYEKRDQVLAFQDEFERRMEARPGITRVGLVNQLPLAGTSWSSQFQAEGWPPERVGFEILHRRTDAGYFEALDIPLVRGRMFGPDDGADTPPVVLINETFAREHFPGEDPIGQKIAYDRTAAANPEGSIWYEIIGIVGDQMQTSPAEPARAEAFENRDQDWGRGEWFVIRTAGSVASTVAVTRGVLHEMDPLIPLAAVRPIREVWRESMAQQAFILTLLGAFGAMALLLAAVGVYGVTAQAARKRTQEIGIRMALGAGASDVVGLMLRQGLAVVGLGLAAGLAVALLATRAIATFLYGVEPTDPATLVSVVALLAGVAAVASYVPARRATSVDPVTSLRAE